jgi:hypothetical protein
MAAQVIEMKTRLRRVSLPGILVACLIPAFAQSPIPDAILFRVFFLRVAQIENGARLLEAQGNNAAAESFRGTIRREAGLTIDEATLLNRIAIPCNDGYKSASMNGTALLRQLRQSNPALSSASPQVVQQIQDLEAQRQQVILDCLATLRSGMKPFRFDALYKYVSATEGPNIHIVGQPDQPKPTAPPAEQLTTGEISVTEPRPLARVAEILTTRYGVPVSYEDVSAYAYDGDLSAATSEKQGPRAAAILPRSSSLKFFPEALAISFDPVRTADPAAVAKMLGGILAQHEAAGNPGRFKLLETAAGLVIVPTAVRDYSGTFIPDQSLLDMRISFQAAAGDADSALLAFRDALKAVSGKEVSIEGFWAQSGPVGANNEIARDVLARILNGLHHFVGPTTNIGDVSPSPRLVWSLTAEPAIESPHATRYHIAFRSVVMEDGYPSPPRPDGRTRRRAFVLR